MQNNGWKKAQFPFKQNAPVSSESQKCFLWQKPHMGSDFQHQHVFSFCVLHHCQKTKNPGLKKKMNPRKSQFPRGTPMGVIVRIFPALSLGWLLGVFLGLACTGEIEVWTRIGQACGHCVVGHHLCCGLHSTVADTKLQVCSSVCKRTWR